MSTPFNVPGQGKEDENLAWFWALAFLWMPAACAILFFAASGPSDVDDIVLCLSLFAVPFVCGIAAWKVSRSPLVSKKIWVRMNIFAAVFTAIGAIALLILLAKMGNALRHM